jgi:FdhD protein
MEGAIRKKILKVEAGSAREADDLVAVEKKLLISINGKEALSLLCSPIMVRELVAGFLMTEGIIEGRLCAERMSIVYGEEIKVDVPAEGKVNLEGGSITSGCAHGLTFPGGKIEPFSDAFAIEKDLLRDIFKKYQEMSVLYKTTGCVHSASVSDGRDILVVAEDIGRHNAVDKAIGYCILEGIPFTGKIMLASGRVSSEIASKCARWKIPLLASRTAPTSLALETAEKWGVTVVGFLRGGRMNVYTHPERIL